MGGKFEVSACNHCWKLADRLSVMVYLIGLRCWLANWRIRDATAEIVSCSAIGYLTGCRSNILCRKNNSVGGGLRFPSVFLGVQNVIF